MLIKAAVYEEVQVTKKKIVSKEIHGCDECGKEIKEHLKEESRLELSVFYHDKETNNLHLCSWECVLNILPKLDSDYFVNLPMMYFDAPEGKISAQHLIEVLRKSALAK